MGKTKATSDEEDYVVAIMCAMESETKGTAHVETAAGRKQSSPVAQFAGSVDAERGCKKACLYSGSALAHILN